MTKHDDPGFPEIKEPSDIRAISNGVIAGLIVIALGFCVGRAHAVLTTLDDPELSQGPGHCSPPSVDDDNDK